jgi:hypothetical protein
MATTVGNVGEELNLRIRQGADFILLFQFKDANGNPTDLTGATFKSQIRKTATTTAVTKEFLFTVTDAVNGEVKMSLTAAETRSIKAVDDPKSGENVYVWDMEMVDSSGITIPLYYGNVSIFREVTRG